MRYRPGFERPWTPITERNLKAYRYTLLHVNGASFTLDGKKKRRKTPIAEAAWDGRVRFLYKGAEVQQERQGMMACTLPNLARAI